MSFRNKDKEIPPIPDCTNFKPFFFDKEHCKLTSKCANAEGFYQMDCYLRHPDLCTGVSTKKYDEWIKEKYN